MAVTGIAEIEKTAGDPDRISVSAVAGFPGRIISA